MFKIILGISISYLLGSIPTSYIMAKLIKGIDIRKHGSGNVGATNLMRTVGKVPGGIAFMLDAAKGAIPVLLLCDIFYEPGNFITEPMFKVILGLAAVCGHIWTIFLKFKGGKGVATTIGVFAGLSPLASALALLVWLVTAFLFKYVSLSSITMSISLPIFMLILNKPIEYIILSLIACLFIIYTHRSNIKRIAEGTEYKIGKKIK